jgi:hypothetical protein
MPSMARPALLIALLTILAACGGSQQAPEDVSLGGTWEVELTRGVLPWTKTTVRGQVHLAPAHDPKCTEHEGPSDPHTALCDSLVEGTYSINLRSLLRPHPYAGWTPKASAIAYAKGTMTLIIGGCCDRGEVVGTGRLNAERMEGRWYQQFLSDGPGGRFVLWRTGS